MATCSDLSLKCCVCLELYTNPRVIPCLHTFCLECLQGLVTNDSLTCPQCRANHEVAEGGVASYPVDLSILPELEAAKVKSGQQQKKVCGLCTTGDEAVGYCGDCGEYLCECCRDVVHKRGKMFQSHNVTTLEETGSITSSGNDHSICPQHPGYKLELFCKACIVVVCAMCLLIPAHQGHEYVFLTDMSEELMKKIQKLTKSIEEKEKNLKSDLECVKAAEQQASDTRSQLEAEINTTCDHYVTKIQEKREKLLKQLEAKFIEDKKKIWAAQEQLEVTLLKTASCRAFSSRYQKQGHIFSLTNQLMSYLTEIDLTEVDLTDVRCAGISNTIFLRPKVTFQDVGTLHCPEFVWEPGDLVATLCEEMLLFFVLIKANAQYYRWKCVCRHDISDTTRYLGAEAVNDSFIILWFTPTLLGEYHLLVDGQKLDSSMKIDEPRFHCTIMVYIPELESLIGRRVRGPDWQRRYEKRDNGVNNLGTITAIVDEDEEKMAEDDEENEDENYDEVPEENEAEVLQLDEEFEDEDEENDESYVPEDYLSEEEDDIDHSYRVTVKWDATNTEADYYLNENGNCDLEFVLD